MFAFIRAGEGLLAAHLGLLASFLVGAAVFPWCDFGEPAKSAAHEKLLRVVATCGLGFAVLGFCAFALALIGAFNPPAYIVFVVAISAISSVLWKRPFWRVSYWISRWSSVAACWDVPSLVLYCILIVLSLPAIIANMGGSDAVGYHLVYADEWAKTGRLVVDPFLRLPFYASNFVLLFAVMIMLHAGPLVNFLSWSMALLTALGVYSAARSLLAQGMRPVEASVASAALALAVIVSPAYLRWMDTAYIDAAIGAFGLFALLCVLIGLREERIEWLGAGAVTAGFLIGMKGSFFVLTPVFAIVLAIAAYRLKAGHRIVALLIALLVVTGSPWYVRNVVLAGDPAPPAFNVALHGGDGLITKGEWRQNQSDLNTPKSPVAVAALPLRAFLHAQNRVFREYGVTALMLALYVPILVVLALYFIGRRIDASLLVSAIYLTLLVGYWVASSSLLRYSSLFYPSLAVAFACAVAVLLPSKRTAGIIVAAICCLAMVPGPDTSTFYHETIANHFRYLPDSYKSDDYYLSRFSPDYKEVQLVADLMKRHKIRGRVYLAGPRVQYNFAVRGIDAVGDWMGPAGYFRLYRAIDAGLATQYLETLDVRAVLITPDKVIGGLDVPLERQLTAGSFCEIPIAESQDRLFVSASDVCSESVSEREKHVGG
jgi:hypothetical protein